MSRQPDDSRAGRSGEAGGREPDDPRGAQSGEAGRRARATRGGRREQIKLSDAEVAEFLESQHVVVVATNGRQGWPHLMPLWYVIRGEEIWSWTYAKSQKVKNLERDDRVTLQIETGEEYHELRGVMVEARAVVHRELDVVAALGAEIFARYSGGSADDAAEVVRAQAAKRVGIQFIPQRLASWDHRKLGGVY